MASYATSEACFYASFAVAGEMTGPEELSGSRDFPTIRSHVVMGGLGLGRIQGLILGPLIK